jgi:DNA-binding response OmpR family regulator
VVPVKVTGLVGDGGIMVNELLDADDVGIHDLQRHRCVVFSDDPLLRTFLGDALLAKGYHVNLTATVDQALQDLVAAPTVAVVDLDAPEGAGWELLLLVTDRADGYRRYPELEVVALCSPACGTSLGRATELGAVSVIDKPFSVEKLYEVMLTVDTCAVP